MALVWVWGDENQDHSWIFETVHVSKLAKNSEQKARKRNLDLNAKAYGFTPKRIQFKTDEP